MMTAEPWTPEEIDRVASCGDYAFSGDVFRRAIATIRALQAEVAELKTPSGYWTVDGDPLCYDDGTTFSGSPVESFAELERWATQCLFDDGARIVARPYRAMPEETYIVRWAPDEDDPDMRRVKLERVE